MTCMIRGIPILGNLHIYYKYIYILYIIIYFVSGVQMNYIHLTSLVGVAITK